MFDFAQARKRMVDSQLRTNDVTDHAVLEAFLVTPREAFVAKAHATLAYRDDDVLVTAPGEAPPRYLTQPRALARMVQALAVDTSHAVLIIGAATGYSAAILAQLSDSVIALEADSGLAARASDTLDELGVSNAVVMEGELSAGYPEQAPFDAILVDGAVDVLPETLPLQLSPGGRLVATVGRPPYGRATMFANEDGKVFSRQLFDANARLLPGFGTTAEFAF